MDLVKEFEQFFVYDGRPFSSCRDAGCLTGQEVIEDDGIANSTSFQDVTLEYCWSEVTRATNGFSKLRMLGKGRTGTFFKGRLEEGVDVAIKVVEEPREEGVVNEIRLLSRLHHPNVAMLLGFSHGAYLNRQALVFELLPGGSLHQRLHNGLQKNYSWEKRFLTAIEASRGMAHLHRLRPEVFHRGLTSHAILFGGNDVAKIGGFGDATTSKHRDERWAAVADLGGIVPGYTAPECSRLNVCTEGSEVFAMGVVLLEILSARKPAAPRGDGNGFSHQLLIEEVDAEGEQAQERVMGLADPGVGWPEEASTRLAALILQCLIEDSSRRPTFLDVVAALQQMDFVAQSATKKLGKGGVASSPARSAASGKDFGPRPTQRQLDSPHTTPPQSHAAPREQVVIIPAYSAVGAKPVSDLFPSEDGVGSNERHKSGVMSKRPPEGACDASPANSDRELVAAGSFAAVPTLKEPTYTPTTVTVPVATAEGCSRSIVKEVGSSSDLLGLSSKAAVPSLPGVGSGFENRPSAQTEEPVPTMTLGVEAPVAAVRTESVPALVATLLTDDAPPRAPRTESAPMRMSSDVPTPVTTGLGQTSPNSPAVEQQGQQDKVAGSPEGAARVMFTMLGQGPAFDEESYSHSPKGSDEDTDMQNEQSRGRSWLQGAGAAVQGLKNRWAMPPRMQSENQSMDCGRDVGSEYSVGDGRREDSEQGPAGPRRWLERVIVRRSASHPNPWRGGGGEFSDYDGSSDEEAEGRGPAWLQNLRWPNKHGVPGRDAGARNAQDSDSFITSDEEGKDVAGVRKDGSEDDSGDAAAGAALGFVGDIAKGMTGATLLQDAYLLTNSGHDATEPNRAEMGKLFHISDCVE